MFIKLLKKVHYVDGTLLALVSVYLPQWLTSSGDLDNVWNGFNKLSGARKVILSHLRASSVLY
jgi:hypothetical protein